MNAASAVTAPTDNSLATGVEGLDHILGGGYAPAHLHLIEGEPGTGKTTLALQFLRAGSARGERCRYITRSESRNALIAGAAGHGWSLGPRIRIT